MPSWMPKVVHGAHQVVLLVLDGLGWHQLEERRDLAPTLSSGEGSSITTVAPTTTVTALTSITTGLSPGEHGMMGYRMDMGRRVVQMLRWADERGDVRATYEPSVVQPTPPFLGASVPILSKAELEGTAFTEAHLRGGKPLGWRVSSSLPVQIGELLDTPITTASTKWLTNMVLARITKMNCALLINSLQPSPRNCPPIA